MSEGGTCANAAPSPLLSERLPIADDPALKFAELWEAKAFAIIVKLAEDGVISWPDWVACFSREVAAATAAQARGETPKSYYAQWLDAAETILIEKGVTSREQLFARRFAAGSVGSGHTMA
jgi:nitrile hydratase accessory protein